MENNTNDYILVNKEYKVEHKTNIGFGSFGHVYSCTNIKNNKEYACKLEPNDIVYPVLQHEYKILKLLEGRGI